jgi:molybdopterin molybdotransferase
MTEFLKLISPKIGLDTVLKNLGQLKQGSREILTEESLGFVLAEDIIAPHSLPSFARSTVDGFAVISKDTYGSSNSVPSFFEIIGEVKMGSSYKTSIKSGQVFAIHTGGMVPDIADAVIMVEDTQKINDAELEIYKAVSPGENILNPGEDIRTGDVIIHSGTRIRSVEIGGLMALGIMKIPVIIKPKVAIISSGDEIVNPSQNAELGKVRDVNSNLLSALISQWGGTPIKYGIIPDNIDELLTVSREAFIECDVVVFTAGSSVSVRDITADAIRSLGEPGVIVHGINIRPGKPTILAICSGKPVVGLPGNPVSAYVTANIYVKNIINQLIGLRSNIFEEKISAILMANVASKAGREDWIPVKIMKSDQGYTASPIFSRSNYIYSLVSADGMIQIDEEKTGLNAGELVSIIPIQ